ncbi:hypothetical protein EYR41_010388 [Orbilia oligospora]|uniref:Uncharacterized protein n=1 Tax=Orbilia oligospora TaxID=2813651 RepID=A0A7C8K9T3_ORBOL|nr:hypothetical protein TWF751_011344 [Orbilia oligospora]TGJ64325.1 hypothetical protein EYR41_010388 [Orbilia oligospora]
MGDLEDGDSNQNRSLGRSLDYSVDVRIKQQLGEEEKSQSILTTSVRKNGSKLQPYRSIVACLLAHGSQCSAVQR